MKRIKLAICVFLMLFPLCAFAHSGRTDSQGGHTDHSTGIYHYHHGYPAHSHTNGRCPYDYDDKTGENSSTSSSGSENTSKKGFFDYLITGIYGFFVFCCFGGIAIISKIIKKIKKRP